jgi:transcriptional regulator with XRE-family HTH domain
MEHEWDWIRAALAEDKSKSQKGLAQALRIHESSVSRMLKGQRRLKFSEAHRAAEYLGVEPPGGFAESEEPFEHGEKPPSATQQAAPLYFASTSADSFWRLDRKNIVERKAAPPILAGAISAFGVYAPDDAMAPRFKIGEIAWINPARPAAPGDDALLAAKKPLAGGLEKVLLCELVALRKGRYIVKQHARGQEREFDNAAWSALHVMPRS